MDYDVRLGLSPTDLQLREISTKRPDEWVDLNPDDCVELRLIQEQFPGSVVQTRLFRGEKTILINKKNVVGICRMLRDSEETNYNYLSDITCFDRLDLIDEDDEDEIRFEVIYNLYSMGTFQRLRLKAQVSEDDATIDTVEGVWPNANWGEREVYDMFRHLFQQPLGPAPDSDARRLGRPPAAEGLPAGRRRDRVFLTTSGASRPRIVRNESFLWQLLSAN